MPKNKAESVTTLLKENTPWGGLRTLWKGETDQWCRSSDWLVGSPGAYDFVPRPSYDGYSSPFVAQGYQTEGLLTNSSLKMLALGALLAVVVGYVWFQRPRA